MKIKFDGNQDFQIDAIRSVVDVFDGQPLARGISRSGWRRPAGSSSRSSESATC